MQIGTRLVRTRQGQTPKVDKKALIESLRLKNEELTQSVENMKTRVSKSTSELQEIETFINEYSTEIEELESSVLNGQNAHDTQVIEFHKRRKQFDDIIKSCRIDIDSLSKNKKDSYKERSSYVNSLSINDKQCRQFKREITAKRNAIAKTDENECPSIEFEAPVRDSTLSTVAEFDNYVNASVEKIHSLHCALQRVLTLKNSDMSLFVRFVRDSDVVSPFNPVTTSALSSSTLDNTQQHPGRSSMRRQSRTTKSDGSSLSMELAYEENLFKWTDTCIRIIDRRKAVSLNQMNHGGSDTTHLRKPGACFDNPSIAADSSALAGRLDFSQGNAARVDFALDVAKDLHLTSQKLHKIHWLIFKDDCSLTNGMTNASELLKFIRFFSDSRHSKTDTKNKALSAQNFISNSSSDALIDILGNDPRLIHARNVIFPFFMRKLVNVFPEGLPKGLSVSVPWPVESKILQWDSREAVDNTLRAVSLQANGKLGSNTAPCSISANVLLNIGATRNGSRLLFWNGVVQGAICQLFDRVKAFNSTVGNNSAAKKLRVAAIIEQVASIRPARRGDPNHCSSSPNAISPTEVKASNFIIAPGNESNGNTQNLPSGNVNSAQDLAETINKRLALVRGDATYESVDTDEEGVNNESTIDDILERGRRLYRKDNNDNPTNIGNEAIIIKNQVEEGIVKDSENQPNENICQGNKTAMMKSSTKESSLVHCAKALLHNARQEAEVQAEWETFLSKISFKSRQELLAEKCATLERMNNKVFDNAEDFLQFLTNLRTENNCEESNVNLRNLLAKRVVETLPEWALGSDEVIPKTESEIQNFINLHLGLDEDCDEKSNWQDERLKEIAKHALETPGDYVKEQKKEAISQMLDGFGVHTVIRLKIIETGTPASKVNFCLNSNVNTILPIYSTPASKHNGQSQMDGGAKNEQISHSDEEILPCGPGGELLLVDLATDEDVLSSNMTFNSNNSSIKNEIHSNVTNTNIFNRSFPISAYINNQIPRDPVLAGAFNVLNCFSQASSRDSRKCHSYDPQTGIHDAQSIAATSLNTDKSQSIIDASLNVFLRRIAGEDPPSNVALVTGQTPASTSRLCISASVSALPPSPIDLAVIKLCHQWRMGREHQSASYGAANDSQTITSNGKITMPPPKPAKIGAKGVKRL